MIATLSDWLKNLETKTNCSLYPKTFPRFEHVIGKIARNSDEFIALFAPVVNC